MSVVLLWAFVLHGQPVLGYEAPYKAPSLCEETSAAITSGATEASLSKGKQTFAEHATHPSSTHFGLQKKAPSAVRYIIFRIPVHDVISSYAARTSGGICLIKYFSFSIQPQAP